MMKQIFPSANEKRELQEQARADMELQLQMKEEMKKQALIDELEHAEALQQHVSSRNTWKLTIRLLDESTYLI